MAGVTLKIINVVGKTVPRRPLVGVWRAVQRHSPRARGWIVSLAIVGRRESRRLNRIYRKIDAATDVLSFPAQVTSQQPGWPDDAKRQLGDIVVCYPIASVQARQFGHSIAREITELFAHGLAHLLGFGHATPAQAKRMSAFEANVIAAARKSRSKY